MIFKFGIFIRYRLKASSCPNIYRNSMTTIAKEEEDVSVCFSVGKGVDFFKGNCRKSLNQSHNLFDFEYDNVISDNKSSIVSRKIVLFLQ